MKLETIFYNSIIIFSATYFMFNIKIAKKNIWSFAAALAMPILIPLTWNNHNKLTQTFAGIKDFVG